MSDQLEKKKICLLKRLPQNAPWETQNEVQILRLESFRINAQSFSVSVRQWLQKLPFWRLLPRWSSALLLFSFDNIANFFLPTTSVIAQCLEKIFKKPEKKPLLKTFFSTCRTRYSRRFKNFSTRKLKMSLQYPIPKKKLRNKDFIQIVIFGM